MGLGISASATRLAVALGVMASLAVSPAVAAKIPQDKIRNPDPKALATGIRFHSSISPAQRKILIDDLAWLARKGPIRGSGHLSRIIGAGDGDVDGIKLVAWMFDKISVVSGPFWDPMSSLVVLSNLAPERGIMAFPNPRPPRDMKQRSLGSAFGELMAYHEPWRTAQEYQEEVDGFIVDGFVLPAPRSRSRAAPIVRIDLELLEKEVSGPAGRIIRLLALLHESAHVAFDSNHVACRKNGLSHTGKHKFGDVTFETKFIGNSNDCDQYDLSKANVISNIFLQAMADKCDACSADQSLILRRALMGMTERVQTIAAKPFTIPKAGLSPAAARNYAGRPLDAVPSKPWFDATAYVMRAEWPNDLVAQRDLALIRKAVESAAASGAINTPWAEPGGTGGAYAGDIPGARAWIQRATSSAEQPALTIMPPCSQFTNCQK